MFVVVYGNKSLFDIYRLDLCNYVPLPRYIILVFASCWLRKIPIQYNASSKILNIIFYSVVKDTHDLWPLTSQRKGFKVVQRLLIGIVEVSVLLSMVELSACCCN